MGEFGCIPLGGRQRKANRSRAAWPAGRKAAPVEHVEPLLLAMLFGAALVAGCVDALAGGGGLITLPVLLLAQVPPVQALATNKLQGSFGTLTSAVSLHRRGLTGGVKLTVAFVFALVGSVAGAVAVQFVDRSALDVVVPVVLILIALYFLFVPAAGAVESKPRMGQGPFRSLVVPTIGFYDGALGPGAGSFFAMAGVSLRGQHLVAATAQAKILNFATNIAALAVFVVGGQVMWLIGAVMVAGQVLGSLVGSFAVVKGGARLIRPVVVTVCVTMVGHYLWQKGIVGW